MGVRRTLRYTRRVSEPRNRSRGQTSPDRLIAAAIAIVDRDGVDGLTIRRLGDACGVTPMAVYRHFRDKDELLDHVVDAVLADLATQELTGSWREQIVELVWSARATLLDHPGMAALCVHRPTPVSAVARFYDRAIAALEAGGYSADQAILGSDALLMFLFGSVLWETPRTGTEPRSLLAPTAVPEARDILAQAETVGRRDPEEYFASGLGLLLDGLERAR